jgi:hypothetical protein
LTRPASTASTTLPEIALPDGTAVRPSITSGWTRRPRTLSRALEMSEPTFDSSLTRIVVPAGMVMRSAAFADAPATSMKTVSPAIKRVVMVSSCS